MFGKIPETDVTDQRYRLNVNRRESHTTESVPDTATGRAQKGLIMRESKRQLYTAAGVAARDELT